MALKGKAGPVKHGEFDGAEDFVPPEVSAPDRRPAGKIQEKFATARREMGAMMVERDDEIDLVLTALLCREHPLLVGPPGCGKSMLLDSVMRWCGGGRGFSVLLTKFTTPEEVFGPVSVKGLKEDRYARVTTGKLPEANFAFLDEIWKGSSAILNTTLRILNEREYDDGNGGTKKCPLLMCVAASNEWPSGDDGKELGALFDRFLFRKTVAPVSPGPGRKAILGMAMANPPPAKVSKPITAAEVVRGAEEAAALPWTADAKRALWKVLGELNSEGIFPGDRRTMKAIGAARAFAYLSGHAEVEIEDLTVLQHVLWDDPEEQPKKAAKIVLSVTNPALMRVNDLVHQMMAVAGDKRAPQQEKVVKYQSVQRDLQKIQKSVQRDAALTTCAGLIKAAFKEMTGGVYEE